MKILFCYLLWYIYFIVRYFDPQIELWLRSLGIAILVGFVLNINSFCTMKGILNAHNKWQVFRFFAIPFCVSSFPVLIKDKGFFVFFSPIMTENVTVSSLCLMFLAICWISRRIVPQNEVCEAKEVLSP
jgi:hypothetical protein